MNTETAIEDTMNNVNSHYSEENNCKTELSVQYIFLYKAMYCTVIQTWITSYMIEQLSPRCISNPVVLKTFLYILLMYTHFFLVYFLLSLLTNQFQSLWHKTLLQNFSPCPYLSKIPAVSTLLHSKMLCSQAPQAKSTKLTQAFNRVGYQNTEVRGVTFIWFPW